MNGRGSIRSRNRTTLRGPGSNQPSERGPVGKETLLQTGIETEVDHQFFNFRQNVRWAFASFLLSNRDRAPLVRVSRWCVRRPLL